MTFINTMLELSTFIYALRYEVVYDSRLFNRCNGWQHGIVIEYDYDLVRGLWNGYMDKPHGIESGYYSDGSIRWLKHWRNGALHGTAIDYYPDGSIGRLKHWRAGKKIEICDLYQCNVRTCYLHIQD